MKEKEVENYLQKILEVDDRFKREKTKVFDTIEDVVTRQKAVEVCFLFDYAERLFTLDSERALEVLTILAQKVVKQLSVVPPGHREMAWQVCKDDEEIKVLTASVQRNASCCIEHDCTANQELSKAFFELLSFNGEDFILIRRGIKLPLTTLLEWYVQHKSLVAWLSYGDDWQRWPEFLLERVRDHRLSRGCLCDDLQITGWRPKRKLVNMLEKKCKDNKPLRFKQNK